MALLNISLNAPNNNSDHSMTLQVKSASLTSTSNRNVDDNDLVARKISCLERTTIKLCSESL